MTALLALDPGCHTGVAIRRADGTKLWRTWELIGAGGVRLDKLYSRLNVLHDAERFVQVGYEAPYLPQPSQPGNPNFFNAVRPLCHYEATILLWAAQAGIPCFGYTPSEIKCAVADGKASKARVIERVRMLGHSVEDEHQADAVALLLLLERGIGPAEPTRKQAARDQRKRVLDLFSAARTARRRAVSA
jgi:Holliday junction resolvasome RuvABC endonuclease subunit